ncbi:MAG TPA: helix-turn-helix domain-containing protein [Acidimicrobiia bacterium]|nr:helix-turn-helix domain-containing protein [Acidimicrobiia bacterium]
MPNDFDEQVTGVAALGDPVRRGLYRYVVAQADPVSRDEAAAGVGVAHHVAKFHLDRLEQDGLLEVEFSRPPGRGGPGAGRPAKLYRRSSRELVVSLPERRYDLAGRVMARAITVAGSGGLPIADTLHEAARDAGRSLGEEARRRAGPRPSQATTLEVTRDILEEHGYEPRAESGGLTLANCPFHALAQDYPELVCGMNLDLLNGMLDAFQPVKLEAHLDPAPDRCCVTLHRR